MEFPKKSVGYLCFLGVGIYIYIYIVCMYIMVISQNLATLTNLDLGK